MQTFLPYPSFPASAAALDDRRLGNQRVETFQILRALVFPAYAWKNHPAVAMWRGFTPALVGYGLAVCAEWERRGYADAVAASLLTFTAGRRPDLAELRLAGQLPPRLGDADLHRPAADAGGSGRHGGGGGDRGRRGGPSRQPAERAGGSAPARGAAADDRCPAG